MTIRCVTAWHSTFHFSGGRLGCSVFSPMFSLIGEGNFLWIREAVGVFSAVLISYRHLYPHFGVPGTTFTGERGNVPTRGYDELGKAGECEERQIKLRFQSLGSAESE